MLSAPADYFIFLKTVGSVSRVHKSAVGFDLLLLSLIGHLNLQFGHLRAAAGLMPVEALSVGQALFFGFGVIL